MTSPRARRGLFCDLDGTLADSMTVMRRAYDEFLEGCGVVGTAAEFNSLVGPALPEIVAILADRHGLTIPADALLARYQATIDAVYRSVPPCAGAGELLAAAKRRGWRVAVVTANDHHRTCAWLERTGLTSFIDEVIASAPHLRGKPAPDLYLEAITRCSCTPAASLALEDSFNGAQAALAAGLTTVVVGEAAPPPGAASVANLAAVLPLIEVAG